MRRYLMHQPERGVHTFRYYGLYGSQATKKKGLSEAHLGKAVVQKQGNDLWHGITKSYALLCECCGEQMVLAYRSFRSRIEKPLIKEALCESSANVQQEVQSRHLTNKLNPKIMALQIFQVKKTVQSKQKSGRSCCHTGYTTLVHCTNYVQNYLHWYSILFAGPTAEKSTQPRGLQGMQRDR